MTTMASITLDVARILTDVVEGISSAAGSTITLIDTAIPRDDLNDDHFKRAPLWVLSGSAYSEGSVLLSTCSSFTAATGKYTFNPPFTYSIGTSGISYAAGNGEYPRDVLKRSVNMALENISPILALNSTALTTVSDQESYSLPLGVQNVKLLQIANSTTSPYDFVDHTNWTERNSKLYFDTGTQPRVTGLPMNLWYATEPTSDVSNDTASISAYYPTEWLKWEAASQALTWRNNLLRGDDPWVVHQLSEAKAEAARCRNKYMSSLPDVPWEVHLAQYGQVELDRTDRYTGTVRV